MQTMMSYNTDVFFKYVFGRNEYVSIVLRKFLLDYLLEISVGDLSVNNPELIPYDIMDKNIILDIYLTNNEIDINIEMQKSTLSRYIYRRFQYYGAKMIAHQLTIGEGFQKIKDVYQIIFIEDVDKHNLKLIEIYHAKQHVGEKQLPYYVQTTIYVYLPFIEILSKTKERLSEFEALIYLLHKGTLEDILYEEKEGVISMVERLHSEFIGNKELMRATMMRYQKKENFQLWHDMDVEDAKQEGIQLGRTKILMEIACLKYPNENCNWLKECSLEQIEKFSQAFLMDIDYEEFKNLILQETI